MSAPAVRVGGIDHVNVSTTDLAATKLYYAELLGLEPRDPPMGLPADYGCWLVDHDGHAILHIVRRDPKAGDTGAIDHVSLRCSGKDALIDRLERMGREYRVYAPETGPHLVFTHDPHGILLELTFAGD
jgi:catechol 2,3-dioxygenase-like lactoylglutathione lyase family enzyme